LVSEGGARPRERKLNLAGNPTLNLFIFWASVAIFPGIFLLLGGFVYFLRRS